ncbi:carbohydrate kinase [Sphingopyxis sp.]|uniref:FGGY-family carbohydrate kinase n=1 Tax=Sphingopyxis sp. TaxID=1908224 RepID=UPI002DF4C852|nr:carbohydrate kinase [Sphingopyxis sp.]
MSAIIVIDLGKTLSKVSLWSSSGEMLDRQVRPNERAETGDISRLDALGIETWLVEALGRYAGEDVGAIVPVGHGAGVVAVSGLTPIFLPLDYEQPVPPNILAAYREERDSFVVTGSPALPGGLNLGAQLYWMDRLYPRVMAGATLLPWAQYWALFLSGRAASEVTSLGCHSDLWNPLRGRFAPLADRMGWSRRFAPLSRAGDILGPIRPEIAARTGLPATTQIYTGLHDSNAALLAARGFAEIEGHEATILSTGTWFVAMRLTAEAVDPTRLREGRDCLVNVDAYGRPVPSARFMGGREIETVIEIDTRRVDIRPDQPKLLAAVPAVIEKGAMMRPTLAPDSGPFPDIKGGWLAEPADWYERRAAMCLYAALVADTSLSLIGSRDRLLVEGRFAEAEVFVRALAALRPETQVFTANAHNDVSFGALRLVDPSLRPRGQLVRVEPLGEDLSRYRQRWTAETGAFA